MKKLISVLLTLSLAFGSVCLNASASGKLNSFSAVITPSKQEYARGEEIRVGFIAKNNSSYIIDNFVIWVEYSGNECLGPGVGEIDYDSAMSGVSVNGEFALQNPLAEKSSAFEPIVGAFLKAYMFVSRTVVIIRRIIADASESITGLFTRRYRETIGSTKVLIDGKETMLTLKVSYSIKDKAECGETDFTFAPISADELKVSGNEKKRCRDWFEKNIVNAGTDGIAPAYNFEVNGIKLSDTLSDWQFKVISKDEPYEKYRNGKISKISLSNTKLGIKGRVEAVIYENNATCEWTVYLENGGKKDSGKISNFCAIDTSFNMGKCTLYASKGSSSSAEDFALMKFANTGKHSFICREGRSSDYYMPYFNLSGKDYGICLGIGWSGQWNAAVDVGDNGAVISAKQETLNAKLIPGEEIRSPLISLTFYENKNPVKGFNLFRNWVLNSLLPEDLSETMMNVDAFFVSPTRTADEMLRDLRAIPTERYKDIDNLWMDAGWYCSGKDSIWDDRFGTWQSTENRFPKGIKEIADFAKEKDTGLVLWYEEERLSNTRDSQLYVEGKKHSDWIIGKDSSNPTSALIWNFGNAEALEYIEKLISKSIKDCGVTVYREDSNFDPLSFWKYGDKHIYGGRNGICENHYVDGHYRFIDYLFEDNESLTAYDCCASGGRRLDLEVIRRGVPLWRSDYNCAVYDDTIEATQAQTYSASFWLPYTGTYYYAGNDYRARTTMYQGIQAYCGDMANDVYYDIVKYKPEREMMNGNFYPILYGGTDLSKITAMQYGDEKEGFAVIYKRKNVAEPHLNLILSGLDSNTQYSVYDYDKPNDVKTFSGQQLMNNALTVDFAPGEQAIIIEYRQINNN